MFLIKVGNSASWATVFNNATLCGNPRTENYAHFCRDKESSGEQKKRFNALIPKRKLQQLSEETFALLLGIHMKSLKLWKNATNSQ